MAETGTKKKVVWVFDKGVNRINNDRTLGELLNTCAGCLKPQEGNGTRILECKDAENTRLNQFIASSGLREVRCPIAEHVGLPLKIFAKAPAGVGEEVKGEYNMVCMHLSKNLCDNTPATTIRGRVLLCLDEDMDLTLDLVVKLLFFLGDMLRDTVGVRPAKEIQPKLVDLPVLFFFYGPNKCVKNCDTLVMQTAEGPKQFSVEQLKMMRMQQQRNQQMQISVPPVLVPYFKDSKFMSEVEQIVHRGWTPPETSFGGISGEDSDQEEDASATGS